MRAPPAAPALPVVCGATDRPSRPRVVAIRPSRSGDRPGPLRRRLPAELFEAARIDGANPGQVLLHIYLPEARPAIGAFAVITFLGAWNLYFWPLLILRTEGTETVTLKLAVLQGAGTDPNLAMAGAVLSVLPILLLFVVAQRQFVQGISRTGLVG